MEHSRDQKLWQSHWAPLWRVSVAVLSVTTLLKAHWIVTNFAGLDFVDPVLAPFTVRTVGLLAILFELVTIGLLLMLRTDTSKALVLLWWAVLVGAYRYWFPKSTQGYCPCFGYLPEMLGLTPGSAGVLARIVLQSLLAGALLVLGVNGARFFTRKGKATLLGFSLIFLGPALTAQDLTTWKIEGLIERAKYRGDVNGLYTENGKFSLLVNTNSLALQITITNNPYNTDPRTYHYEFRTDGKHSVSFGRFDTNILYPDDYIYPKKVNGKWQRVTNDTPRKLDNTAHAILSPTPLPHAYTDHAIPVMLGFGWHLLEKLYEKNDGPQLVDDAQSIKGELKLVHYNKTLDSNSRLGGLASLVSYYPDRKHTNDLFFTRGRLSAEFGNLPETLHYLHFLEPEAAMRLKVNTHTDLQVTLVVTNCSRSSEPPAGVLQFSDVTMVDDERFSLRDSDWIPSVMYTSTNGSLPTVERVMSQPFYYNAVQSHAASERQNRKRRIFFLTYGILPAIIFGWWVIKQNKKLKSGA